MQNLPVATDTTPMRTQDEITTRIATVEAGDVFGFRREVLIDALDHTHAHPYLKDGVSAADWNLQRTTDANLEEKARWYLDFAIGKILDHRGISASRSVDKLAEYAWLLGRDDVVAAMDKADYEQYGAPKVKAFADGLGWPWPKEPILERMAAGLPCDAGCDSGCGR